MARSRADQYEIDVAEYIGTFEGVVANRPRVSSKYSDILVEYNGASTWIEVKMNHTDNLGNPRVSYVEGEWIAALPLDPIKRFGIEYLRKDKATKEFLADIGKFSGNDPGNMILPSTMGLLKKTNAVPRNVIQEYFRERDQYILAVENIDLGKLVTDHYILGKKEPAHYMQAGDDFYMIGKENPLGLPGDITPLSGVGTFKMRIGIRSKYYEIQPEIKIQKMPESKYSIRPGTEKINPFRK